MEEEMKGKKISVSVVLLIIALIVMVVMGVFLLKLINDKKVATDEVANVNNNFKKIDFNNAKIINAFEKKYKITIENEVIDCWDKIYLFENLTFTWKHQDDIENTLWGSYNIDNSILYLIGYGYEGNGTVFPDIEVLMNKNEIHKFLIKDNNLYDLETNELLYLNNASLKNDEVRNWFEVIDERYQYTAGNTTIDNKKISADEVYKSYISGLKNSLKTVNEYGETFDGEKYDACLFYSGSILEFDGIENVYLKSNGDLYVQLSKDSYLGKKYGTKYKMTSNVVRAGVTEDGQDGNGIYVIKDDGKFYYCKFSGWGADSSENSLELKEITELKNIVNIESLHNGETMIPFAFDIDGNIFDISKFK